VETGVPKHVRQSSPDAAIAARRGLGFGGGVREGVERRKSGLGAKVAIIDIDDQDPTTGREHASNLPQRRFGITKVLEEEAGVDEVETPVREWKASTVRFDESDAIAVGRVTIEFGALEKQGIEIHADDLRLRRESGDAAGHGAGSAREVENPAAIRDAVTSEQGRLDRPRDRGLGDESIEFGVVVLEGAEGVGAEVSLGDD
jgi:hypothetical protein